MDKGAGLSLDTSDHSTATTTANFFHFPNQISLFGKSHNKPFVLKQLASMDPVESSDDHGKRAVNEMDFFAAGDRSSKQQVIADDHMKIESEHQGLVQESSESAPPAADVNVRDFRISFIPNSFYFLLWLFT